MTKERLEKRINELLKAKEQFLANANACEGGIIELQELLKSIDEDKQDDKLK